MGGLLFWPDESRLINYSLVVCVYIYCCLVYFLILFSLLHLCLFMQILAHSHTRLLCTSNTCLQNSAPPCFEWGMCHFCMHTEPCPSTWTFLFKDFPTHCFLIVHSSQFEYIYMKSSLKATTRGS